MAKRQWMKNAFSKVARRHGQPVRDGPKYWEPDALRFGQATAIVVLHCVMLLTMTTLLLLSITHDGFVEIRTSDYSFLRAIDQDMSIIWTSLAPFLLQLFTMARNLPVDEACVREPFAQLAQHREGNASASVLLDYRSKNIVARLYTACKHRHWHLVLGLFTSIFFTVVLTPLSAALFHDKEVTTTRTVPIMHSLHFDEKLMETNEDWKAPLDAATSEDLYAGRPVPWTNSTHAFQPFQLQPEITGKLPANASVTGESIAYAAHLACRRLNESEYTLTYSPGDVGNHAVSYASFSATDRGCALRDEFDVQDVRSLYLRALSEFNCPFDAGSSRVFLLAGLLDPGNSTRLANFSAISCMTGYSTTPGRLTVTWDDYADAASRQMPTFGSFVATGPRRVSAAVKPDFFIPFETGVVKTEFFTSTKQGEAFPTEFGTLVLEHAVRSLDGDDPTALASSSSSSSSNNATTRARRAADKARALARPDLLAAAAPTVFASVFRAAASLAAFGPRSASTLPDVGGAPPDPPGQDADADAYAPALGSGATARLAAPQRRLLVRAWVAALLLGATATSLAGTVVLAARPGRAAPSGLAEEPAGLLASVGLLALQEPDPALRALAADVAGCDEFARDGAFVAAAARRWRLEDATFFLGRTGPEGSSRGRRLCVEGLRRRVAPAVVPAGTFASSSSSSAGSLGEKVGLKGLFGEKSAKAGSFQVREVRRVGSEGVAGQGKEGGRADEQRVGGPGRRQ